MQDGTPSDAVVVTLSEGGLAVRTALDIEEGDEVQIRLLPKQDGRSITLQALAWNTAGRSKRRTIGFVVSDPPPGFLRLLEEASGPEPRSESRRGAQVLAGRRLATPQRPAKSPESEVAEPFELLQEQPVDPALPRPKDALPPGKPDPLESLPLFRVRVKHLDGPRSRRLEIRARSVQDCESWIRHNLEGDWEILEHSRIE